MLQAEVENATGWIIGYGAFPSGSPDPATITIVDLTPAQEAVVLSPTIGQRVLGADGIVTILPPPPPPTVYFGQQILTSRVTTVGTTVQELFRQTLAQLTAYRARVELFGVDRGNGNVRDIEAKITVKRLNAGAIVVPNAAAQSFTLLADHRDGTAGTWVITPSISGNDFVITVTGAATRTIDWFCRLTVDSFTPGG